MKKLSLLAAALLLPCLCVRINAQEPEPPARTVFKLSPQHFTINALKAGVERFNKHHSASVAVFVTGMMAKNQQEYYDNSYDGLAGELQFRKYVSPMKSHLSKNGKRYHQGIYGAVYVQGGSYSGEFAGETYYYEPHTANPVYVTYAYEENIGNWGGGFIIGYQKTLWQAVFLEAFIGGGLQFSDRIVSGPKPEYVSFGGGGISDPAYRGILPKVGLNIGIGL